MTRADDLAEVLAGVLLRLAREGPATESRRRRTRPDDGGTRKPLTPIARAREDLRG